MVAAVKLRFLWGLGCRYLPAMMDRFEAVRRVAQAVHEGHVPRVHDALAVAHAYRYMNSSDFSCDVLQQTDGWCGVIPLTDIEWCDWGRPERVQRTLDLHDATPVRSLDDDARKPRYDTLR